MFDHNKIDQKFLNFFQKKFTSKSYLFINLIKNERTVPEKKCFQFYVFLFIYNKMSEIFLFEKISFFLERAEILCTTAFEFQKKIQKRQVKNLRFSRSQKLLIYDSKDFLCFLEKVYIFFCGTLNKKPQY